MMNYFDYAASSMIYPEVLESLARTQSEDFANPGAQHLLGQKLYEKIEDCRYSFLKFLGGSRNDFFIFTSSATESNNTVIRGLPLNAGDVILFSLADHPSVTVPIIKMAELHKIELREILLNTDGTINEDHFLEALDKKVKLVVLTHVNNQSGVVHDVESLSLRVKEKSTAHVHIDAVQSFGKIPFKVSTAIDSVSLTSHKIGGPKGIAGLYLKADHKVQPLIWGGAQEHGFRSSTQAFPLIEGFHLATKITLSAQAASFSHVALMNEMIRAKLSAGLTTALFPFNSTSPYIVAFILPGISSDIILRHLEMKKVYISSTAACSSKVLGFNSSLFAMNIPEKNHKNFLRISLGPKTSLIEVENLIEEFLNVWRSLKPILTKDRGR